MVEGATIQIGPWPCSGLHSEVEDEPHCRTHGVAFRAPSGRQGFDQLKAPAVDPHGFLDSSPGATLGTPWSRTVTVRTSSANTTCIAQPLSAWITALVTSSERHR